VLLPLHHSVWQEVKAKRDADLLVLPTDAAIFDDEGFRWVQAVVAATKARRG
jgi:hypothetical protein